MPVTKDEYKDHIGEIRHYYLFDAKGVFVQELNQTSPHSQRIHLRSLPIGKYTVMSLANKSSQFSHFPDLIEGKKVDSMNSFLMLNMKYIKRV